MATPSSFRTRAKIIHAISEPFHSPLPRTVNTGLSAPTTILRLQEFVGWRAVANQCFRPKCFFGWNDSLEPMHGLGHRQFLRDDSLAFAAAPGHVQQDQPRIIFSPLERWYTALQRATQE